MNDIGNAARREEINSRHMENGVLIIDPAATYIDGTVEIGAKTVIYPGCILEGACKIGEGAVIGPYSHMRDTLVGNNSTVRNSVTVEAVIGDNTDVGPFAYLRPEAVVGDGCRIGNFVEIKKATLGDGSKMAHLAYIGDAEVGRNVNISCGVITANYDGKKKHLTVIEDDAFIGCNSNLVAPVKVGKGAFVAAGSTIDKDLPEYSLGIARERQITKEDWARDK